MTPVDGSRRCPASAFGDCGVEVVAEGPPAGVDRLVDWCRSGPRHAHVGEMTVVEEPPTGVDGFRIVR